jgi:hypothetical protein
MPQLTTGRDRGGAAGLRRRVEVASRYLHRSPAAPVSKAVSEGGIPRARDYKVTDEGTDGRRDRDAAGRYANATSAMAL